MSLQLSPVVSSLATQLGVHFSARRLDLQKLGTSVFPVMGFDHYRMSGPTFSPHPHAGFSAVSYVLEDSPGGLRNRDSLGHDLVIEPGALVWTQAGAGVVHDEFPERRGQEVHGLQIFINLGSENKQIAPRMLHVPSQEVPIVKGEGVTTRVLSGVYDNTASPIDPAEPFDMFDVQIHGEWIYRVPPGRNVLVYVVDGTADVGALDTFKRVSSFQAVAVRASKRELLTIRSDAGARAVVLSGTDPQEPVAVHGPFIMNDQNQLSAAFERYRRGEMGRLHPVL